MSVQSLELALSQRPFRPFEIRTPDRVVKVDYPEQVSLTPKKTAVLVAIQGGHFRFLDADHIGTVTLKRPRRRKAELPPPTPEPNAKCESADVQVLPPLRGPGKVPPEAPPC